MSLSKQGGCIQQHNGISLVRVLRHRSGQPLQEYMSYKTA